MRTLARLVLFGALACGFVAAQQAQTPAGPPSIHVISQSWVHIVSKTKPPDRVPNSQTVAAGTRGIEPIDPTPNVTETNSPRRMPDQLAWPQNSIYVYSAEILNAGSGDINALSWDYLFIDPVTHDELKRQTGFFVGKIHVNQKKKLQIRTRSSPPRVINAGSMKANGAPFDEHLSIQCILFADGSFWENPESKGISCDKLRILQRGPVKSSNEIIG